MCRGEEQLKVERKCFIAAVNSKLPINELTDSPLSLVLILENTSKAMNIFKRRHLIVFSSPIRKWTWLRNLNTWLLSSPYISMLTFLHISLKVPFTVTAALTSAVLLAVCGCFSIRGKSVRNSGKSLVIFPLMVLAAYSSLGDATQQGTTLWVST